MRHWLAVACTIWLAACGPATDEPASRVGVTERMAAQPDPGFRRAYAPKTFEFPADHGAHPDFATEWWYFTGNLTGPAGERFGYQFTLFRVGLEPGPPARDSAWRAHQLYMGHLAITDIQGKAHLSVERFSRAALGLAGAETGPVRVWLGDWSMHSRQTDRLFPLELRAGQGELALELTLEAGKRPRVLQGDRGWSRKSAAPGNASYYYSHTRLPTSGRLRIGERWYRVSGNSWFDREWSSSALAADQAGWDWFSLQLEDGRDLMFYRLRDHQGRAQSFSQSMLLGADGSVTRLSLADIQLRPTGYWSSRDGVRYPLQWQLSIPAHDIALTVTPAVNDQEMRHSVRYWEGAVRVSGSQRGVGYLELSGYD